MKTINKFALGAVIAVSLGGYVTVSGTGSLKTIKQSAAKAVVAAYGADLSPKQEMRASTDPQRDEKAKEELGYIIGSQAYLYGLPSLRLTEFQYGMSNLAKLARKTDSDKFSDPGEAGIKYNEFAYLKKLPQPDLKIGITPNVDTLYGSVFYNVKKEPVIINVPKILDRYYSVQITDSNLSNVAYLGTRATQSQPGDYALTGPDWNGSLPDKVQQIKVPTNEGFFAVRIQIDGPEEEAEINKVQAQFDAMPLSNYIDPSKERELNNFPKPNYEGELSHYRRIVENMQRNPPATPELKAAWENFQYIGMSLKTPFNPDKIDPAIKRGMARAIDSVHDIIAWKVKFRGYKSNSNWNVDLKGGRYGADYLARAEGAIQGLVVHDSEEAMYFHTYHDGGKQSLHGDRSYTLHFEAENLPPVDAFWSITVYGNDYNIVANPIDRYSINSHSKDLKYNKDGSLTINIQAHEPKGELANWLPIAAGDQFRLNYRTYMPQADLRNADLVERYLPPVTQVN